MHGPASLVWSQAVNHHLFPTAGASPKHVEPTGLTRETQRHGVFPCFSPCLRGSILKFGVNDVYVIYLLIATPFRPLCFAMYIA